ncbi:hypothetical protein U1Q18_005953 [Sarracenia purpurea var. burkii]
MGLENENFLRFQTLIQKSQRSSESIFVSIVGRPSVSPSSSKYCKNSQGINPIQIISCSRRGKAAIQIAPKRQTNLKVEVSRSIGQMNNRYSNLICLIFSFKQ